MTRPSYDDLVGALRRLLDCPDLNMCSMEQESLDARDAAQGLIDRSGTKKPLMTRAEAVAMSMVTTGVDGLHRYSVQAKRFDKGAAGPVDVLLDINDYVLACRLLRALREHVTGVDP